jgi:hypothetical protein
MIVLPSRDAQPPNTGPDPPAIPVLPAMAFVDLDNPLAAEILRRQPKPILRRAERWLTLLKR